MRSNYKIAMPTLLIAIFSAILIPSQAEAHGAVTATESSCRCSLREENLCYIWNHSSATWLKKNKENDPNLVFYGEPSQMPMLASFSAVAKSCARSLETNITKVHYVNDERETIIIEYEVNGQG